MSTDLDERVRALERALTTRDDPPEPIPAIADVSSTVTDLELRVVSLESRVDDLAARQEAVEAYVDRIDHVDEAIERRADAALAAVDRLESTLQDGPHATPGLAPNPTSESDHTPNPSRTDLSRSTHVTDAASSTAGRTHSTESSVDDAEASDSLFARVLGL